MIGIDIEKINRQLAYIKQHTMNTEFAFQEEEEVDDDF